MCNYQGYEFGANYPDSVCVDGRLWDADSGDSESLSIGGDIPCPKCNGAAWREWYRDDVANDAFNAVRERTWPFRRLLHFPWWGFAIQLRGVAEFVWSRITFRLPNNEH